MVIKRISPMSLAKVSAVVYGFLGLIAGVFFALFGTLFSGLAASQSDGGAAALFGMIFGIGGLVFFPVFYAVCGFIGGLIVSAVYNLAAGWTGGIEIEAH